MHAIAAKALITILAAAAVGAGVVLFTIAKQDGSKTGQILGRSNPSRSDHFRSLFYRLEERTTSTFWASSDFARRAFGPRVSWPFSQLHEISMVIT